MYRQENETKADCRQSAKGLGFRLRPTENSLNIEQNKTMMVHYVKVEFYLSIVKLRYYKEQSDEIIQYKYNNKKYNPE